MANPPLSGANRLLFLDVGRGIAVLGVVCVHTVQHFPLGFSRVDQALQFGRLGLQLFYAISAYTMCLTLGSRIAKEKRPVGNFFIRRYCRLAFPYWTAMLLYFLLFLLGNRNFVAVSVTWYAAVASALLLHGFWPTTMTSFVPGGGSIAVEVIFYLVFPFVFRIHRKLNALFGVGIAAVLLDRFCIVPAYQKMLAAAHTSLSPSEVHTFLQTSFFNQFPIFLIGVVVFCLVQEKIRLNAGNILAAILFAATLLVFSPRVFAAGLGLLVLMLVLHRANWQPKPLVWLGQRSYSLYLFHFAMLDLILYATQSFHMQTVYPPLAFVAAYAVVVLMTVMIAALTKPKLEDFGTSVGKRLVRLNEA